MGLISKIDEFIAGRIHLSARDVQQCFFIARGLKVSRTTLDDWEGRGLPVARISGRKWYDWKATWAFYCSLASHRCRRNKGGTTAVAPDLTPASR